MSNNIGPTRAPFFPRSKEVADDKPIRNEDVAKLKRNDFQRVQELKALSDTNSKVDIPDAVKDFSRIKKAVDQAPDIDKSNKIAQLKDQISSGTYQIDYDALANKVIEQEF